MKRTDEVRQPLRLPREAGKQPVTYQALQRRNAELEARVRQAEARNVRLQASQRRLRQAERLGAVGQLAAMIVHEIRGPLTGIAGQAEMLLLKGGTERQQHGLEMILEAAWGLNDLAERILRFSRSRSDASVDIDLGVVAWRAVELLSPLAPEGVDIQLRAAPGPLMVRGSAAALDQVLTNLLLNAIDAASSTGGRITASTGVSRRWDDGVAPGWSTVFALAADAFPRDGSFAYAEIADDGPGIDGRLLPRLFEPPFRDRPVGEGTGLGLAICRNIVRDLGGNVRLTTRSGSGTRVRVYLPTATPGDAIGALDEEGNET